MENDVKFSGVYRIEKKSGVSKKTGISYIMYFVVFETPIGERRFLIDKHSEMGVFMSVVADMC